MTAPSKADAKFMAAIVEAGGEALAATNPYEVLRFKTRLGVGVVYENKRGVRSWNAEAVAAKEHLAAKSGSLAPVEVHGRRTGKGTVDRLLERDGGACFFCAAPLNGDVTVEHLVAVAHGGPNHVSNLFLAHADCNQRAGHLSAPEKVSLAARARATRAAFDNRLRGFSNIDGHLLPELTPEQQREFVRDPVRYYINTDKAQSDAIWREVERRQG